MPDRDSPYDLQYGYRKSSSQDQPLQDVSNITPSLPSSTMGILGIVHVVLGVIQIGSRWWLSSRTFGHKNPKEQEPKAYGNGEPDFPDVDYGGDT